jgi:hypothetical protein
MFSERAKIYLFQHKLLLFDLFDILEDCLFVNNTKIKRAYRNDKKIVSQIKIAKMLFISSLT